MLYNNCIEVYNLTYEICEQEIVTGHTFFSESMTGTSGGVRIDRERQVNGPVRVHPKLWQVGWDGCHRYMAMVSESISRTGKRSLFYRWLANPFRPVTDGMDFSVVEYA